MKNKQKLTLNLLPIYWNQLEEIAAVHEMSVELYLNGVLTKLVLEEYPKMQNRKSQAEAAARRQQVKFEAAVKRQERQEQRQAKIESFATHVQVNQKQAKDFVCKFIAELYDILSPGAFDVYMAASATSVYENFLSYAAAARKVGQAAPVISVTRLGIMLAELGIQKVRGRGCMLYYLRKKENTFAAAPQIPGATILMSEFDKQTTTAAGVPTASVPVVSAAPTTAVNYECLACGVISKKENLREGECAHCFSDDIEETTEAAWELDEEFGIPINPVTGT